VPLGFVSSPPREELKVGDGYYIQGEALLLGVVGGGGFRNSRKSLFTCRVRLERH